MRGNPDLNNPSKGFIQEIKKLKAEKASMQHEINCLKKKNCF